MITKNEDEEFLDYWAYKILFYGAIFLILGTLMIVDIFTKQRMLPIGIPFLILGMIWFTTGIGVKKRYPWAYYGLKFVLATFIFRSFNPENEAAAAQKRIKEDNLKNLFRQT